MSIKLSISIPTFNKANILDNWFTQHETLIKKYKIPIFISDNKSTDKTLSVITNWSKKLNYINYSPVNNFLKAEANFERAINLPQTGWVWPVGDSYLIDTISMEKVISTLSSKDNFGFCVVNIKNKLKEPSNNYISYDQALEKISGAVSCISCNLYNLDVIGNVEFSNKDKSYFPHATFFFDNIKKGMNFYWINNANVNMIKNRERRLNWSNTSKVWEISIDSWHNCIDNLNGYSNKSKLKAWVTFGIVSGLFSIRGLLMLRAQGLLTRNTIRNRVIITKRVLGRNYFLMRIISFVPILPLKFIARIIGYQ